jgi:hypothetical protein
MGVRFQCPNGHKLHVKAELAGRRGICPECKARFVVPSFSGGRAAEADATPSPDTRPDASTAVSSTSAEANPRAADPAASSIVAKAAPQAQPHVTPTLAAAPAPQPSDAPIAPLTASPPPVAQPIANPVTPAAQPMAPPSGEPLVWYIRPAAGGQFGPATEEVFRQWVVDGRVAADSWVWRTGWPDWKGGVEALALVADRPPQEPSAAIVALDVPKVVDASAAAAPIEPGSAEARRQAIKRRKQRVRMVSAILAVVALVMLTLLVIVLVQ